MTLQSDITNIHIRPFSVPYDIGCAFTWVSHNVVGTVGIRNSFCVFSFLEIRIDLQAL